MNTYLLSAQALGGLFSLLLFALCFLGVHIARLAKIGWEQARKVPPAAEKKAHENEERPPSKKEVYYIVERKRRPPKNRYRSDKRRPSPFF